MHGTSKYGISRTIRVVLDLMTVKFLISYSTRPLQIFGLLGMAMGSLGVARSAPGSRICKFVRPRGIGQSPAAAASASCLILIGVQLVTLGLLGEMQARTYHESQDKPIYVIREILESERSREDEVVEA